MSRATELNESLRRFKLFRWYVGGKWAYMDGRWWHMNGSHADDYCIDRGRGFHFTYLGIEKREDYS